MSRLGRINYELYNKERNKLLVGHQFWKIPYRTTRPYDIAYEAVSTYDKPRILDVGANNKSFRDYLEKKGSPFHYKSFDTDTTYDHDYQRLEEIDERFDIITMFAVVEHIEPRVFIDEILPALNGLIESGGLLIIYTNNIYHPLGIRTDIDHVIGYGIRELHAICVHSGFESSRYYRNGGVNRLTRPFYEFLSRTILWPYRMDYATSIYYEARK